MGPQRMFGMTPWVRRLFVANLVVFLFQMTIFVDPRFLTTFGFVPLRALAQPWPFLTYMFLHGGPLHLAFNLLALYVFGPEVEERMGGGPFLCYYLLCGLGGAVLSFVLMQFRPVELVIGASAAVYGVLLAFAWAAPDRPIYVFPLPEPIPAKWLVTFAVAVSLALAIFPPIDKVSHLAHLGGFGAGFLYLKVADWRLARAERHLPRAAPPSARVHPGLAAPDPAAAYHEYLDRHRPVLASYWHNYVLDPGSPHAEQVIAAALGADRADLKRLLADVDVVSIAEDALQRALERFEADCPVDLYLMVGVGAANAGELVVGGRGIAFLCLEHFTGRANPQTYGMGLAPHLLPLWVAHETAHAVRYTSPTSRADLRRLVADRRGHYDYWDTGSRASLRELLVNEGAAVAAAQAVAPGLEPWEYFGYTRRQYRRIRELDAFLRRVSTPVLDQTGLGLRLRFLSGWTTPAARVLGGRVVPERAGYYLGLRLVENYLAERGLASPLRAAAQEFRKADDRALGIQTAW